MMIRAGASNREMINSLGIDINRLFRIVFAIGVALAAFAGAIAAPRSEEHTSELQSLMRISYAVFCLKKKKYTLKCKSQQSKLTNTVINKQQQIYTYHIIESAQNKP